MLVYILKSSACLAVFLIFYKLFLEKENMHFFKRFYLIFSVIIALCIPFITFTQYLEASSEIQPLINKSLILNSTAEYNYLPTVLWSIYGIGVFVFGILFLKNLFKILYIIKQNIKVKSNRFTNVLLQNLVIPHTFFSYIFLNKHKFETHQIPKEVLLHEETHAIQKHSLDILFIEILQVIFWFNPLMYVLKQSIKLNHEFLADKAVLNKGIETSTYQNILLAFSSGALQPLPKTIGMANAINYSLIKKRFTVMKTKTSKQSIWIRSIILLPLLAITLYSFSDKIIVEKEKINLEELEVTTLQEKATEKQVAEYNALAKKYNEQPADNKVIKLEDLKRLEYIYHLMSDTQKKNAQPFPNFPLPPPAPDVPKVNEVKEIAPPPPLPNNATPEQKRKYKEGYKDAQVAAKVLRLKTQKGELVKVRELRSDKDRQRIKTERLAHREAQVAARVLKNKEQKEQLVRVRAIRYDEDREKLKTERLAHREAQVAAKALKLKAQKEQLVRVRAIRSDEDREKLKTERLVYREAQVADKVLKLKAQKEQLIRVKEIRLKEDKKRLKEEKKAYKKAQAKEKAQKRKSKKKDN